MNLARHSFTMIELIFAIVIVGLTILTIPTLITQSARQLERSHDVRGYYHALALMQIIRVKPWDKTNLTDTNTSDLYYILDTDENIYDCADLGGGGFLHRAGMLARNFKGSRICSQEGAKASAIAGNSLEAINFSEYREDVKESALGEREYTLKARARYVKTSDLSAATTASTNTKKITIELLNKNSNALLARYHYYAANIGTDAIASKEL